MRSVPQRLDSKLSAAEYSIGNMITLVRGRIVERQFGLGDLSPVRVVKTGR